MEKSAIFFILSALAVIGNTEDNLPDYLHICKKSTPDLDRCIQQSVEVVKPYLIEGIPDLDIPKIEPINIGDLVLSDAKPGESAGLEIIARNIKAFGCSDFTIGKIEIPEYGRKYNFKINLPHLYVQGRYTVDGRILLLPIKGSGRFTGNFTECIGDVKVTIEKIVDDNKINHMEVKKLSLKITVGKGNLFLDNLFGGNKELGRIVNDSINSNFSLYLKEIIPLVEKALAKYFSKIGNKIIERYSDEQLFPL